MKPGELLLAEAPVRFNVGKSNVELEVENTSAHTVFISSHFPFFEVNRRLAFDRAQAWGMHLDVPAGDTVRWRPGERKSVRLVAYSGRRVVRGFNKLTDGLASPDRLAEGRERARQRGYADRPSAGQAGQ